MKALVTGGAGFIGSNLVDYLISSGHQVVVIDNESAECNDKFYWNESAENHKLDITDYDSTRCLYDGVDVVFHLAAEARIQPCIINPLKAVHTNMFGTATVLQCAREAGVKRVVYSSTSSAYGLANTSPLIESMPTDCLNPYSVSKVGGEELCKMYSKLYGMQTVIFRYFNVFGERQPFRGQYATVTGIFKRLVDSGQPLTVVGDGEQRRDFIYVGDIARANVIAATFEPNSPFYEWGQVHNIGFGSTYSINEIADIFGSKEVIHLPSRQGEARDNLSDCTKAKRELGWSPLVDVKDWIVNSQREKLP